MKAINITPKEFEAYERDGNDVLSDCDYGMDRATKEFTVPKVEWDGIYGTYWVAFDTEEERTSALDSYQAKMNAWVLEYRKEQAQLLREKRAESKRIQDAKTLGGQFPQLAALRNTLS